MKNLKQMNTDELLTSFNSGQGKTNHLPDISSIGDDFIVYDGNSANVSQAWKDAYILMQLNRDLKDLPVERQEKLFAAYNEGRLSLNHRLESDTKQTKPLAGHYLTSQEYYNNVLKLAASFETVQEILTLAVSASKKDAAETLDKIRNLIIPVEKMEVFEELQRKEESVKTLEESMKRVVTSFKLVNPESFNVSVEPANLTEAVTIADDLGFTVADANFDAKTMKMAVSFTKSA